MHPLEDKIRKFLDKSCGGENTPDPALVEEFGERCKALLVKFLYPTADSMNEPFRLRMSNIGKDVRQLILEKKHGRKKPSADFLLKMLYGGMYEEVFMHLLSAAGVNYERSKQVTLDVAGTEIKGEMDVKVLDEDMYGIYDVKTASPYSYDVKFASYDSVLADDSFGYICQGYGYGKADGAPFKGWLVINKVDGKWKLVETPNRNYVYNEHLAYENMKNTVDAVNNDRMPACKGLEAETFRTKPTGRTIIGKKCMFCDHKTKCHPTAVEEPCKASAAKVKPMKWYVK